MSPHDIIRIPGYPDMWARRVIVEAWQEAGSPPINDAGRLYEGQKRAWDAYQAGTGNPADNPDRPDLYALGHVRFVALDIDATPDRVRRLTAAGLVRPFPWESWHWAVPNVYAYGLVKDLPTEPKEEDDMFTDDDRKNLNELTARMKDSVLTNLTEIKGDVKGVIERTDDSILPTLTIIRVQSANGGGVIDVDALADELRESLGGAVADELAARLTR